VTDVALSSDSTCVNQLRSANDGYETLRLRRVDRERQDARHPQCLFPDWMQGKWESLEVDGGVMTWRDSVNFKTYRGLCQRSGAAHPDRFVLSLDTGCGRPEEARCALFQQRDRNVMEFQLGEFLLKWARSRQ